MLNSAANMAAKKTSKKTPSKSDFIRAQPATMSAAEVVAKAKAEGVKLLPGLVYEVRRKAKEKRGVGPKPAARRATKRAAPAVARPITTSSKTENLLHAVAAEVGLGRAIELLEAERARVHAVMRG